LSYILEALRKSQQERDLGRVPTVESSPVPGGQVATARNYWGVAAVGLAALAVVIALYAALRGASEGGGGVDPGVVVPQAGVTTSSGPGAAAQPAVAHGLPPAAVPASPAPPPEGGVPTESPPGPPASTSQVASQPSPAKLGEQARPSEPGRSPGAVPARDDGVPEDLRQEIEAFKRQVRGEPAAADEADAAETRPQDLRLPREVKERLPAFLMTVHIYDRAPEKRFVLINARKYREGERTPQDLLVEEILPDGVVLSYEGHRFFRHR
jgi:general secretion pathway protein B